MKFGVMLDLEEHYHQPKKARRANSILGVKVAKNRNVNLHFGPKWGSNLTFSLKCELSVCSPCGAASNELSTKKTRLNLKRVVSG